MGEKKGKFYKLKVEIEFERKDTNTRENQRKWEKVRQNKRKSEKFGRKSEKFGRKSEEFRRKSEEFGRKSGKMGETKVKFYKLKVDKREFERKNTNTYLIMIVLTTLFSFLTPYVNIHLVFFIFFSYFFFMYFLPFCRWFYLPGSWIPGSHTFCMSGQLFAP